MRLKRAGTVFMIIGAVLLSAALSLFAYNGWDAWRAGESAAAAQDALEEAAGSRFKYDDPDPGGGEEEGMAEMPTLSIDGFGYIGTLSVPRFGLKLPVIGEWSYPALRTAPARYAGSVRNSDLVICGHNYERHFGNLKKLEPGDRVEFTDILGNVFEYEVGEVIILQPTQVEEMISGEWDLTLFTCTLGGQTRVTVRCMISHLHTD